MIPKSHENFKNFLIAAERPESSEETGFFGLCVQLALIGSVFRLPKSESYAISAFLKGTYARQAAGQIGFVFSTLNVLSFPRKRESRIPALHASNFPPKAGRLALFFHFRLVFSCLLNSVFCILLYGKLALFFQFVLTPEPAEGAERHV